MKKIGTERRFCLTLITVCSILSISFSTAVSAYADQGTEVTAHIEAAESSSADSSAADSPAGAVSDTDTTAGDAVSDTDKTAGDTGSDTDTTAGDTDSPQTGDSADILFCVAVLFVIGISAVGTKVNAKNKK